MVCRELHRGARFKLANCDVQTLFLTAALSRTADLVISIIRYFPRRNATGFVRGFAGLVVVGGGYTCGSDEFSSESRLALVACLSLLGARCEGEIALLAGGALTPRGSADYGAVGRACLRAYEPVVLGTLCANGRLAVRGSYKMPSA